MTPDSLDLWQLDLKLAPHSAVLRQLLGQYLHVDPQAVQFVIGPHGKPEVDPEQNPQQLRFNISHSQQTAVFLFGQQIDLGIDIETHKPRNFLGLAQRYFSANEQVQLAQSTNPEATFYRLWTLKEAYTKANGRGIAYGFDKFSVQAAPPWHLLGGTGQWQLDCRALNPQQTLAIAYRGLAKTINHYVYSAN